MERVNWNQAVRPSTHDLIAAINSGADDIERIDGALDYLETVVDGKADVSGTYPDFVAGEALSIRSGIRSNTFLSRALDTDVADGIAEVSRVLGNTVVVNDELVSSNVAGIEGASACEFPAQTLRGIGTAQDVMTREGIERKIASVDLSNATWVAFATSEEGVWRFYTEAIKDVVNPATASSVAGNIRCVKYPTISADRTYTKNTGIAVETTGRITVFDPSVTTAAEMQAAAQGLILYYEVATPTTETFTEPLDLTYRVEADGSEAWIVPNDTQSAAVTGEIAYPLDPARALITHESFTDFCDKLGAYIGATITETWDGSKYTYAFASGRSALLGSIETEPDALEVTEKDDMVKEIIEDERKEL